MWLRVDVGDDFRFGLVERHRRESLAEPVAGRRHQRCVEGAADRERQHALCTALLGELGGAFDRLALAGDDDLSRRVVVRHPDLAFGECADRFGIVVVEAEDGDHRSRVVLGGVRHRRAALGDEITTIFVRERTGRDERGVLTEAVAGAECRLESESLGGVEDDAARDESR